MASAPKKQRTHPQYELFYWPGIPGRGEFVRLAFEATNTPYVDVGNEAADGGRQVVSMCCDKDSVGDDSGNPPSLAPPGLRIAGEGKDGKALFLSQTPNILLYLGPKLGLAGEDEVDRYHVNGLTLTALDLNNEAHDTHHPIAVQAYYEEQKDEALKKSADFRENRIPKFVGYFERVFKGNSERGGKSDRLVGSKLTYADTTLWHVLSGLHFAFPNEMKARAEEFPLCRAFYEALKEEKGLKEYLESERRLKFSKGIFRYYPELDRPSGDEE